MKAFTLNLKAMAWHVSMIYGINQAATKHDCMLSSALFKA